MAALLERILTWVLSKVDFESIGRSMKPIALMSVLVLFGVAAWLTQRLWSTAVRFDQIMSTAVLSKLEGTSEPYKGLEAVLVAGLTANVGEKEIALETREFFKAVENLKPVPVKELESSLEINSKTEKCFLTMSNKNVYTMVPWQPSRSWLNSTSTKAQALNKLSKAEQSVLAYIAALDRLDSQQGGGPSGLCSLVGNNLLKDDLKVDQAYFIAGVNMAAFCMTDGSGNPFNWPNQFLADREFSNKPYYKETVLNPKERPSIKRSAKADSFFHKTPPYIDTTSKGFVQSFCRDVVVPPSTESNAMFCFDVTQPQAATEAAVREKVAPFGGDVLLATCTASTQRCESQEFQRDWLASGPLGWLDPVRVDLNRTIVDDLTKRYSGSLTKSGALEKVDGGIGVLSDEGRRTETFIFSVGVGKRGNDVDFLVSEIQVDRFEKRKVLFAATALLCLVTGLMILVIALVQKAISLEERSKTVTIFQSLMKDFTVPYCHCDKQDKITHFNVAFANLLGFSTVPQAEPDVKGKAFMALLADNDSVDSYEAARQLRSTGDIGKPYNARLVQPVSRSKIGVKIYGAAVPNPLSDEHRNTQTFGLFLTPELDNILKEAIAKFATH